MNTKELRDFMIDVSENGIGELAKRMFLEE